MASTDEAVILAGGFGTRLRSVVKDVPKPMAPVAGRPFLAHVLDLIARQGIRRAVLATGFMAELVERELGRDWQGMELAYSPETEPLGTGGAIAKALPLLAGDAFFVLNGDTFLSLDYAALDRTAHAQGCAMCMALTAVPDVARYGAVVVEGERVTGFREKGQPGPGYINAGVYRLRRDVQARFPGTANFSFETDVMPALLKDGQVSAFAHTQHFIDIGVPEDYERAQTELAA
ncbi:nucleotidyltransferase family protein [Dyella sp. LX-66]|uniref:nucleotidyltransferase family protein n=1 Tax=unclassified Dyella TaxID=2634549 RepID=UPI001BDFDB6F|nr:MULTISPECIES: nucleotidyltransferase family protein [unclassified Dyella]MBT2117220.1 nucleotidyltransferase family protein [Dyella sp. LX-1]MBT2138284.1 nucleotidyltransferase family protein [Dyella sp. LX-66]